MQCGYQHFLCYILEMTDTGNQECDYEHGVKAAELGFKPHAVFIRLLYV
jgi:hypothetical protein